MEDVPPSYDSAIDRDAWSVIAPWIPSSDLCSASLVSRKWHNIFAPFLWGDPASHFGTENDAVYVALTRFKRTLKRVRLSVRGLTHTLHLPPALSEIYGGPKATWLRDVLEYLPNLQSLLVSKLPFFDHQSLIALRYRLRDGRGEDANERATYGLRLLMAKKEPNTTSIGLAEAISHFPQLVYLDLSQTTPARDASVLLSLSGLQDLQVLKLRGIGLRDSEAEVLANAIGIRVRFLDLRDNLLTDMAIRSLMQACFLPKEAQNQMANGHGRLEDWPVGMLPGPDFLSLDSLRSEDLDQRLLHQLTHPLTGRLAFEDIPHRGLTHLYISGNRLSVEGLSSVLKSTRLHVLDAGSVDTAKTIGRTRSVSSPDKYVDSIRFPGAEKLVPILATQATRLTYLRINHAVVTTRPHAKDMPSPITPSAGSTEPAKYGSVELPAQQSHFELPGSFHAPIELPLMNDSIFELSAEPRERPAELPGDIIQFAISPPVNDAPSAIVDATQIKADAAFAPEVVPDSLIADEKMTVENDEEKDQIVLDACGSGLSRRRIAESRRVPASIDAQVEQSKVEQTVQSPVSPLDHVVSKSSQHWPASPSTARTARIQALLQNRPTTVPSHDRPNASASTSQDTTPSIDPPPLHPSSLPHLQTLILTDVPTQVPESSPVIPLLKAFISACADESLLSKLLAETNYSLPPGRSRQAAELQHARTLFALRTLVLEMAPVQTKKSSTLSKANGKGGSAWQHSRQRVSWSKSSTEDRDTENLWSAAENDFSFFGEEGEADEEMGIYGRDRGKYDFMPSGADGLIAVGNENDNGTEEEAKSISSTSSIPMYARDSDIRQELLGSPLSPIISRGSTLSPTTSRPSTLSPTSSTPRNAPPDLPNTKDVKQDEKPQELLDVVASLAAFRKSKKAEFETATATRKAPRTRVSTPITPTIHTTDRTNPPTTATVVSPSDPPFIPGHWTGEVKVIRPSPSPPQGTSSAAGVIARHQHRQSTPSRPNHTFSTPTSSSSTPIPSSYQHHIPSRTKTLNQPISTLRREASSASSSAGGAGERDIRDREIDESEEGTVNVDFYGNRFERGYLYP